MMIKKGALLLVTLVLASASLSLAYSRSEIDRAEKLEECLDECSSYRYGSQQRHSCENRCVREYHRGFEEEEWDNKISSKKVRLECQKECQFEPKAKQTQCQRRCEKSFDPEFPRGKSMSKWDRYEKCQRGCSELGILQQLPCHARCTAEFGLRGNEAVVDDVSRPRQFEECQRQCQFEPRRQQGQCVRRCQKEQERFPEEEEEMLEKCQRRCAQQGPLSQVPCQMKCTAQFGLRGPEA